MSNILNAKILVVPHIACRISFVFLSRWAYYFPVHYYYLWDYEICAKFELKLISIIYAMNIVFIICMKWINHLFKCTHSLQRLQFPCRENWGQWLSSGVIKNPSIQSTFRVAPIMDAEISYLNCMSVESNRQSVYRWKKKSLHTYLVSLYTHTIKICCDRSCIKYY